MGSSDGATATRRPVAGVIEGFYGPPWSWDERRAMIDAVAAWDGDWYVWAPKSEPRHRDAWAEPFTADEVSGFGSLRQRGVHVSVGLTPGFDATTDAVLAKLAPLDDVADGFTICFDDLDDHRGATRHATIANAVLGGFGRPVWLVPTHYAGTSDSDYLRALSDGLDPSIQVMWTGRTVVTDTIHAYEADARAAVTGNRPPLIWDNTPVNDALMRNLLHLGPYTGRADGLRDRISGVLANPMEFASASRPTVRSAIAWTRGRDHLAEWHEEIDALGLRGLAEATAFPGDPHWPGDEPTRGWWSAIADLPDPDDPRLARWVSAARDGARAVLALVDVEGRIGEPERLRPVMGAVMAWRGWTTHEASTFGRGPRMRPVFGQDESGRFVFEAASVAESVALVDRVAARVLGG